MNVFLVFARGNYAPTPERTKPIKAFLNKEGAEKYVEEGENIFYKFEKIRHHCDRLESLNNKIWKDNRPIKTKEKNPWRYSDKEFSAIFYEETKRLLSEKELRYHYQHCKDNNLVHIRCYDSYEIVEIEVE